MAFSDWKSYSSHCQYLSIADQLKYYFHSFEPHGWKGVRFLHYIRLVYLQTNSLTISSTGVEVISVRKHQGMTYHHLGTAYLIRYLACLYELFWKACSSFLESHSKIWSVCLFSSLHWILTSSYFVGMNSLTYLCWSLFVWTTQKGFCNFPWTEKSYYSILILIYWTLILMTQSQAFSYMGLTPNQFTDQTITHSSYYTTKVW